MGGADLRFTSPQPANTQDHGYEQCTRRDGQAELTWMAVEHRDNTGLQTVTHLSTNRARRRATMLI